MLEKHSTKQTLRIVYFDTTQSILQYRITAFGCLGMVACNKLITAQKSIINIILNKLKTFPSIKLFTDFRVFNIQQLFQWNSLYYAFRSTISDNKTI